MAKSASHTQPALSEVAQRLVAQGRIRPASRRLSEVLAERGPLRGAITDAGSRAVQEQRGERG